MKYLYCVFFFRLWDYLSNPNLTVHTYHIWSGCDVTEEEDGNPSADQHCCSEGGESFTAATAFRVSAGIKSDHHPLLL